MTSQTHNTIIKICGLTTSKQAQQCVELGASWIGLNCWPGSSRYIPPEMVREITASLPSDVVKVGVFVNEPEEQLIHIMKQTGLDYAQLHGDETTEDANKLDIPWFKAFRISPDFQLQQINEFQQEIFLMDAYSKTHYGGTGETIDWNLAEQAQTMGKCILAGGLTPDNICRGVQKVRPGGVDVCSGVEESPGIKDMEKVKSFIQNIKKAETQESVC